MQKEEEERVARDYVNPMFDSYSQSEQPQEDQTHPQQFWRVPEESVSYENEDEQNVTDNTKCRMFRQIWMIKKSRMIQHQKKRKKTTNRNHGMNILTV
ncbi:MAG: hypothetical protein ACLUTA_01735 [Blautia wexlerae]